MLDYHELILHILSVFLTVSNFHWILQELKNLFPNYCYICVNNLLLIVNIYIYFIDYYLHGINLSEGDDDSGKSKRRRALGLQCLSNRFSYSGLNMMMNFYCNLL